MYRLSFLLLILTIVSTPAMGQTTAKDSPTLEALLTEVRQLRQDFEATVVIARRMQVLIYRLQRENTAVARLSRSVDDAHAEVNQLENERGQLAADIKQHEDFVSSNLNASGDRKVVEDALPGLKEKLALLDDQLQQAQDRESAAQRQLHSEETKLDNLEAELARLERSFEPVDDSPAKKPQ